MEPNTANKSFVDFLNHYNQAFYDKDIEKLRKFYDSGNNTLIYFDNHKNNDTYCLEDHLHLLYDFFKNGKATESGGIEPISIENLHVFQKADSACLCFITRYKSFPVPAVRATMYLEYIDNVWKIMHVHCSFEPEK